jgi:hypothetical protein
MKEGSSSSSSRRGNLEGRYALLPPMSSNRVHRVAHQVSNSGPPSDASSAGNRGQLELGLRVRFIATALSVVMTNVDVCLLAPTPPETNRGCNFFSDSACVSAELHGAGVERPPEAQLSLFVEAVGRWREMKDSKRLCKPITMTNLSH